MQITESTLEKAVFRLLREHELEPHASIPFRELQGLWAYTGLRQGDLRDALRIMFDKNYVDFENNGDGLAVVITPTGYQHAQESELRLSSLLADARDKVTLRQAGKRYHAPPHDMPGRKLERSADQQQASSVKM